MVYFNIPLAKIVIIKITAFYSVFTVNIYAIDIDSQKKLHSEKI